LEHCSFAIGAAYPHISAGDSLFAQLDVIPIVGGHLDLVVEPHLAINRPVIERAIASSCS
jgi:thioesterase domain-containing protein